MVLTEVPRSVWRQYGVQGVGDGVVYGYCGALQEELGRGGAEWGLVFIEGWTGVQNFKLSHHHS